MLVGFGLWKSDDGKRVAHLTRAFWEGGLAADLDICLDGKEVPALFGSDFWRLVNAL